MKESNKKSAENVSQIYCPPLRIARLLATVAKNINNGFYDKRDCKGYKRRLIEISTTFAMKQIQRICVFDR